jgi:hypothetical protein
MSLTAAFHMTLGTVLCTQVSKSHSTAAKAPGEAQPTAVAEVLSKGRAWRFWLWIALLLAIALYAAYNPV